LCEQSSKRPKTQIEEPAIDLLIANPLDGDGWLLENYFYIFASHGKFFPADLRCERWRSLSRDFFIKVRVPNIVLAQCFE